MPVPRAVHRRHLTVGQRAMVAAEVEAMYAAEAKERQQEAGEKYGRGGGHQTPDQGGKLPTNSSEAFGDRRDRESAVRAAAAVGVGPTAVKRAMVATEVEAMYAANQPKGGRPPKDSEKPPSNPSEVFGDRRERESAVRAAAAVGVGGPPAAR